MENIIIKKSKINNKGVFANRDFKKGEIVLSWKPRVISEKEFKKLTEKNNHYLLKQDGSYFLMQAPEKFVNHSCDPNTKALNKSDIAIRNIKSGEEITSSYLISDSICNCGSKNCKGKINMNTNYKIRNAEPEDVLALHDVYLTTWLDTYPNEEFNITKEDIIFKYKDNKTPERIEERKQRIAQRGSNEIMLVVEDNKKIIALCNASQKEENNQIQAIYVLPEYQRLGLGRALWEEVNKIFDSKKDIIVHVASYNEKGISFYKKLGFKSTGKIIMDGRFKMKNGAMIPELKMIINKKPDI